MALMNLDLDPDGECCEREGVAFLMRASDFGLKAFGTTHDAEADGEADGEPEFQRESRNAEPCASPVRAARSKRAALQAWAALSAMKLAEGQLRIQFIDAETVASSDEAVELEYRLLRAADALLNDDGEAAAELVNDAIAEHESAADHPATPLLLRLAHWKARRLSAFCELSGPVGPVPTCRREAFCSILHLSMEAAVEAEQLRLATAGRLAHEALELSARFFGPDFPASRMATTLSASILYEQNHVDAADRLIRDRLVLSGSQGGIEGALRAYVVGARIAVTRHQVPFAVLLLREAELLGEERNWPRLVALSLAERVRLLIEGGRVDEAEDCSARLSMVVAKTTRPARDGVLAREMAICRARLDLAAGEGSEHSVSSLNRIIADHVSRREFQRAIEVRMLLASILHRCGNDLEAAAEAVSALEHGAAAGLYRTFLDAGEATRRLLEWLFEHRAGAAALPDELRPYVRSLLKGFPERSPQAGSARTRHRSGESLSPRERHILTLMSHGLSNKRIAKTLDITPETVKSHAKHILLKLAAQTRVEAVSRAFSLGII